MAEKVVLAQRDSGDRTDHKNSGFESTSTLRRSRPSSSTPAACFRKPTATSRYFRVTSTSTNCGSFSYLPSRTFQVDGQTLVFDVTRFLDRRGNPFFIYKAPWAEGTWGLNLLREGPQGASFRAFKFEAVRNRWKPRFARVLMGGVAGFQSEEESWKLFAETVLDDLEIKTSSSGSL